MSCRTRRRVAYRFARRIALAALPFLVACGEEQSSVEAPRALVTTATATAGSLSGTAVGYGPVAAAPADRRSILMLHDGIVARVDTREGNAIHAGDSILEIERAPAAAAQVAQARAALEFARSEVGRSERLYAQQLASNDQLAAARKALADAKAAFAQQQHIGAAKPREVVRAPFDGVVTGLSVVPGDQPTVGTTLAVVSGRTRLVADIGFDPADAERLHTGTHVRLTDAAGGAPIDGVLSAIASAIDPTTRSVIGTVELPTKPCNLTLGTTVAARAELPSLDGTLVPRVALLEDADGLFLYTVVDQKAHRVRVHVGAETDSTTLITDGVAPGATVITSGVAQLDEGVAVAEAPREPG
jgi:RND family efflux transporter MFP subunit